MRLIQLQSGFALDIDKSVKVISTRSCCPACPNLIRASPRVAPSVMIKQPYLGIPLAENTMWSPLVSALSDLLYSYSVDVLQFVAMANHANEPLLSGTLPFEPR